jgi:hypothetical protein
LISTLTQSSASSELDPESESQLEMETDLSLEEIEGTPPGETLLPKLSFDKAPEIPEAPKVSSQEAEPLLIKS